MKRIGEKLFLILTLMSVFILESTQTAEVADLYGNCYVCTGKGYSFCEPDWANQNVFANRCYDDHYNDKSQYCNNFNFLTHVGECSRKMENYTQIVNSGETLCPFPYSFDQVASFTYTFKSKENCYLQLDNYGSFLDINYSYPISVYYSTDG